MTPGQVRRTNAASLIEMLVVLFIMGIMMGLLLPALSGARSRVQATACENNVRQLTWGVSRYLQVKKKFPLPNRWSVDLLPWIEQQPLAREMQGNANPDAVFPRPPLMRCPMQRDVDSRVAGVGFCHYVLVVDRPAPPDPQWEIQDREELSDGQVEQPWYVGPEISFTDRQRLMAEKPGPHPPGLYVTRGGLQSQ